MDELITLAKVLGGLLFIFCYAFVVSGSWVPAASEMLVGAQAPKRGLTANIGYAAIGLAIVFITLSIMA